MSVISRVMVVPSRLIALVNTLDALSEPTDRRAVMAMLFPETLRVRDTEADTPAKNAYEDEITKEAESLGLVRYEGAAIALSETGRAMAQDPVGWLHMRLTDLGQAQEHGQSDMPSALVWMLAQDPLAGLDWQKNHAASLRASLGTDLGISNISDFQQLFHWARFLGYAWWTRADQRTRVIPDPTVALTRAIQAGRWPAATRIPVRKFVESLGQACPVLEGGAARAALAERFPSGRLGGMEAGHFSASTGLALQGLADAGALSLEDTSDAELLVLGPPGTTGRRVSYVTIVRGTA